MRTLTDRIADYLRTCVHDNVGETRAYIDPDNIDFMARDISCIVVQCDWISVKDMLPEIGVDVLCHSKSSGFVIDSFSLFVKGEPWFYGDRENNRTDVTHWMPLPNSPQP